MKKLKAETTIQDKSPTSSPDKSQQDQSQNGLVTEEIERIAALDRLWFSVLNRDEKGLEHFLINHLVEQKTGQLLWLDVFKEGWIEGLNLVQSHKVPGVEVLNDQLDSEFHLSSIGSFHWVTQNLNWVLSDEKIKKLWTLHIFKEESLPEFANIFQDFPLSEGQWATVCLQFFINPVLYFDKQHPIKLEAPSFDLCYAFFNLPEVSKTKVITEVEAMADNILYGDSQIKFQETFSEFKAQLEKIALDHVFEPRTNSSPTHRL